MEIRACLGFLYSFVCPFCITFRGFGLNVPQLPDHGIHRLTCRFSRSLAPLAEIFLCGIFFFYHIVSWVWFPRMSSTFYFTIATLMTVQQVQQLRFLHNNESQL